MNNSALQLELTDSGIISSGENVIFGTIVSQSGNIMYNDTTGIITFLEAGSYLFNWWVSTQSLASAGGSIFALSSSQGDSFIGNSPLKTTRYPAAASLKQ